MTILAVIGNIIVFKMIAIFRAVFSRRVIVSS